MTIKLSSFGLFAVVVLLAGASQANAQAYTFTDLGTLGGTYSDANAINNTGQVAGFADTPDGTHHATLWNGAAATNLGDGVAYAINNAGEVAGTDGFHAIVWNGAIVRNLGNGVAYAINNAGQVAGTDGFHATVWNGTTGTDLGTLEEGFPSYARAINDIGQVAGYAIVLGGGGPLDHGTVAVLWNGAMITRLGSLAGNHNLAYGLNNAGKVVGSSELPVTIQGAHFGDDHAAMWSDRSATDLGALGGNDSHALAINNVDQVVGWSITGDRFLHATLWNDQKVTDLNSFLDASTKSAGWVLLEAHGINDNGWIIGNAYNSHTGVTHAFLLTPIPEPETYAMLLAGLGVVGFMSRRRETT
jgi:probable HAF family extracellular repeat protein